MATTTCTFYPSKYKEILRLLELRITFLPDMQKKILALYYFENAPLSQIAACFGLTESEITRILAKAVVKLQKEVLIDGAHRGEQ